MDILVCFFYIVYIYIYKHTHIHKSIDNAYQYAQPMNSNEF